MYILIIALVILALIAAGFGLLSKHTDGVNEIKSPTTSSCATCDGTDARCEQECMMEAATKDIEYFDDEELDIFKGKDSDSYSDDEAEQFREVMLTMKEKEVKDWNRSLILRGINIPNQIKDEMIILTGNN